MDKSLESRALIRLRLKPLRSEVKLDFVMLYDLYKANLSYYAQCVLRHRCIKYHQRGVNESEMAVAMDWNEVNK